MLAGPKFTFSEGEFVRRQPVR